MKILKSILLIPLTILALELILDVTPLYPKFVKPNLYPISKGGHMVYDKDAGYDLPENLSNTPYWIRDTKLNFWTNSWGCNDAEYMDPMKDYILLVGDSFTWGYGSWEKKYGAVLERELEVRVIKAGVSGYGTVQELSKAKKMVKKIGHPPKLIIVGYLMNDFMDDHFTPYFTVIDGNIVSTVKNIDSVTFKFERKTEKELREEIKNFELYGETHIPQNPRISRIVYWVQQHTVLGALSYEAIRIMKERMVTKSAIGIPTTNFHSYTPIDRSPYLKKAWDEHLQHLQDFKDFADKNHSGLLIALLPTGEMVYDCLKYKNPDMDVDQPYRLVMEYCKKHEIAYLNIAPIVRNVADQTKKRQGDFDPDVDFFWKIDGHPSPAGNGMIGRILAEYVRLTFKK